MLLKRSSLALFFNHNSLDIRFIWSTLKAWSFTSLLPLMAKQGKFSLYIKTVSQSVCLQKRPLIVFINPSDRNYEF